MFARVHTYNNCIILIPESSQSRKPLPCIWLVGLPSLRSWRNIWILIKALRGSTRTSQITQKENIKMGAFCCCPCDGELEEYALPSNSIYRHCLCLRYYFHQLFSGYGAMFHRLEGRSTSSPIQGASFTSSGISTALPDNTSNDIHLSVSRPVASDSDQRYSRLQRDGLVSRRDKSMTHFQEDSQPLRRNMSSSGTESLGFGKKRNGVEPEEDGKLGHSESSEKALTAKVAYGLAYMQPSSEDEDVCPTCLDEYTPEDPKITTQCSHHFHLGCIYEWLERSESCPICGKEMEFCESP
ncbi:E3 ubiquitin-protein ligase At3g02290-like isoform X2 [Alnus glutinosa]|uniref:E3 ubiquitin-protein ligase At3g02290-like isoform X2 n=1 Tax=Alnus glutinosa TaxID=3517 RepID=UPI002D79A998|nr:E3 ubiquitin-protein ligase At3g02290-like isoform X2 [Alnus glutinosa]